jgi:hypothetical protein
MVAFGGLLLVLVEISTRWERGARGGLAERLCALSVLGWEACWGNEGRIASARQCHTRDGPPTRMCGGARLLLSDVMCLTLSRVSYRRHAEHLSAASYSTALRQPHLLRESMAWGPRPTAPLAARHMVSPTTAAAADTAPEPRLLTELLACDSTREAPAEACRLPPTALPGRPLLALLLLLCMLWLRLPAADTGEASSATAAAAAEVVPLPPAAVSDTLSVGPLSAAPSPAPSGAPPAPSAASASAKAGLCSCSPSSCCSISAAIGSCAAAAAAAAAAATSSAFTLASLTASCA